MSVSLMVAASAGLLSFLSPCVLPLVPSYLAFVSGSSLGSLRQPGRPARRALALNALGFIVGFSLVFVAMGAGVTLLGGWLLSYRALVQRVGGELHDRPECVLHQPHPTVAARPPVTHGGRLRSCTRTIERMSETIAPRDNKRVRAVNLRLRA